MPAASPAGSRHPCFAPTPGARCRPAARRRRAVSEFDAIAWGNYLMDKAALRRAFIEKRLNLPDPVIGAYWPIKGEFDPLPALHRWQEDGELQGQPLRRRIGLPVVDKQHKT